MTCLDAATAQCSGPGMYRHIPKLVVLSAIGLIILVIYSTQSRGPAAPAAPNVVYVNPNFAAPGR